VAVVDMAFIQRADEPHTALDVRHHVRATARAANSASSSERVPFRSDLAARIIDRSGRRIRWCGLVRGIQGDFGIENAGAFQHHSV